MKHAARPAPMYRRLIRPAVMVLVAVALLAIFFVAPTEQSMGAAQRIVYVHVGVAWVALAAFMVVAVTGIIYLLSRDLRWDHWALAAAEVGWLCCSLTLATGSLWAHEAWNTWWTWDPRLTTAFILWGIYSGYLVLRSNVEEPHQRARVAAVLAVIGALDIPLVVMATRWFRTMHPVAPTMEPLMRLVLLLSVVAFTALFCVLVVHRREQIRLEGVVDRLRERAESDLPTTIGADVTQLTI